MLLHRILCTASSPAICFTRPRTAHFDAMYALHVWGDMALCPATEEMHTMLPPVLCLIICAAHNWTVKKTPLSLTTGNQLPFIKYLPDFTMQ
jgi:hypothetical protein